MGSYNSNVTLGGVLRWRRYRVWEAHSYQSIYDRLDCPPIDKMPTRGNETHVARRPRKYTFGADYEEHQPSMEMRKGDNLFWGDKFILTNMSEWKL